MIDIIAKCPVCECESFIFYLKCKDFTVTNESFYINQCSNCKFIFTNPRPDVNAIGKYYDSPNYISHTDSKKGLLNFIYQLVRKHSIKRKEKIAKKNIGTLEKSMLDVGSGTGDFLNFCVNNGWKVQGIEVGNAPREYAISKYNLAIHKNIEELVLSNQKYSIITLWHVLEHIHLLNSSIDVLKSKLLIGGKLIIAVPNHESHDARYYKSNWAAYDVPRHLYHFSKASLINLLANHGFSLVKIKPMIFDSYYVSLLSEKNKKENKIRAIINGLYRGFISNLNAGNDNYSSLIYIFEIKP